MKRLLTLFSIVMIVAVAGCIGGDDILDAERGYGLEITNFTSSLDQIYSTQTTHIVLRVENQGESKIEQEDGIVLLILPSDWEVTQDKDQPYKKDINFEDAIRGTAAGTDYFRWTVQAPALTTGLTRTDIITGRIYYDYETVSTGNIWIYPESEAFAELEKGNTLDSLTYKSSRGPVGVTLNVVPDPVSVYTDGEIFTLTVNLANLEDGIVYQNGVITSDLDTLVLLDEYRGKVTLTIDVPGLEITDTSCDDDIEFFGNTATAICDIKVTNAPMTKQSYPVTVIARYGYYVDRELMITTVGREAVARCEFDSDCPSGFECTNGRCTKIMTPPTDYKLDAAITLSSTVTTTTPTPAESITYCPDSKIGSTYDFTISDVTPNTLKFRIEGAPDGDDKEMFMEDKGTWTYDATRASITIKIDNIDTDNDEVDATITISEEKVAINSYRFTEASEGDTITLNLPGGIDYTIKMIEFLNVTTTGYPEDLDNATFKINNDQEVEVFRNKAGECFGYVNIGTNYIGIGIDTSAKVTSDTSASIDTMIAVGKTAAVVEEVIGNGFFKDSCATLEEITFASGC